MNNAYNWQTVGTATYSNVSPLGKPTFPLEQAMVRFRNGVLFYYRIKIQSQPPRYLYLGGSNKAYDGEGRYLNGNQPVPAHLGGLYILNMTSNKKEGMPYGFTLPGWKHIGYAAGVMMNGAVTPYKYRLDKQVDFLNPDKFNYRVYNYDMDKLIMLRSHHRIHDGELMETVVPKMSGPYPLAYKVKLN